MKQIILMSVFIALSTFSIAQRSRNWTMGVNVSSCLLNDDRLTLTKFSLEPGFQFNERLYVNLSFAYVENGRRALPEFAKFRGLMNSLSISVRLLKPEYTFSPMINVEFGNIFLSNAKGKMICRDFVISDNVQNEVMGTFSNFRYFAKIKYMLDIQFLGLNFRFGPNYSLSAVQMFEIKPDHEYSNILHGFGVEVGFLYTFKAKKIKSTVAEK
ncbi:MAG: hypothetical protein COA38_18860 [Fluviicola sp.]|nr:MAG: hypothetical protein COA38_18860 [Fluviicola sp.]